jgi:hypothetical protein
MGRRRPRGGDCTGIRCYPDAPSPTVSPWVPRARGWQEITGPMFFAVAPGEDAETPAGCNDVAWPKASVVHSPLVCSLGVLLVRNLRPYRLVARVRNEFLGSATRVLHALLPRSPESAESEKLSSSCAKQYADDANSDQATRRAVVRSVMTRTARVRADQTPRFPLMTISHVYLFPMRMMRNRSQGFSKKAGQEPSFCNASEKDFCWGRPSCSI